MQATIQYEGRQWEVTFSETEHGGVNLEAIELAGQEISEFLNKLTLFGIEVAVERHLKNEAADVEDSRAHQQFMEMA